MSAVLLPGGVTLDDARPAPRRLEAPPALATAGPLRSQLQPPANTNRGTGIAVVVGLHLVLGWGLSTGLAGKAVEALKKPIEMALLPEVLPPPPPPPPPPKVVKIEPVQKVAPPPAYVPPPEVVPVVAPPPPIQVVQATPPKEPPVVVAAAPAPVPAPPPPPAIVRREISLACPGYEAVLASALEEAIERVGIKGTVQTLIKIRGNQVVEVTPTSGPKEYHKYVQAAVKRMKCTAGGADEVQVSLPVIFS
ncbi:energy transducer TonB [Pelomonas cellulosilytica]|uniref:Energy transducer TonB n=1 Tax=Pelomonas cellulosilytica TaxID=2906762 RepID=A0ABS8XME0_9BURK|nr:energy transducer TonB [Pelomonas sp. P8]MCE4553944.1 energy transducer TonB [Pelomonas sp. P8]